MDVAFSLLFLLHEEHTGKQSYKTGVVDPSSVDAFMTNVLSESMTGSVRHGVGTNGQV